MRGAGHVAQCVRARIHVGGDREDLAWCWVWLKDPGALRPVKFQATRLGAALSPTTPHRKKMQKNFDNNNERSRIGSIIPNCTSRRGAILHA